MKLDQFCQSCILPRKHELFEAATEADGTENADYCKLCYQDGAFTQPEIKTAKEMQDFVKEVLKKQGIGRLKRWFYTVSIPQLKRWK